MIKLEHDMYSSVSHDVVLCTALENVNDSILSFKIVYAVSSVEE